MMKKSTFGAVLAFLFAAAGALTAAALYLYRREKELDEYERLLFSDEYDDDYDDGRGRYRGCGRSQVLILDSAQYKRISRRAQT